MPRLILPRRYASQPQTVPTISGSPLAAGLIDAFVPIGDRWVSALGAGAAPGQPLIDTGVSVQKFAAPGRGKRYAGAGGSAIYSARVGAGSILKAQNLFEGTLLVVAMPENIAQTAWTIFGYGLSSSTNDRFEIRQAGSVGSNLAVFARNHAGTSQEVKNSHALWANFLPATVVAVRSQLQNLQAVYLNGLPISAATFTALATATFDTVSISGAPGFANGFTGTVFLALAWNRALSQAEIAQVSANPWQVFEAPGLILTDAGGAPTSFNATLNATLGALTVAATGAAPENASLTTTLGALTLAGTAAVPVNASLSATLSTLSLAGTGMIPVNASFAQTLGNLSLLGTATVPVNASLSITLGTLTLAGVEVGPSFNATLATMLGALALSATAQIPVNAALSQALAAATLAGVATVTGQGSITAGTPIDYWGIKVAIKAQLDAQLAAILPKPQVVVEQEWAPNESWIGVYGDSRTAADPEQYLSAGTKTNIRVRHVIWVWRYAMDLDTAISYRNSLLGDVELALMLDRTFAGTCETSWLEGGRLVTADDPSKKNKFFAGAEIILTADCFARTT